MVPFFIRPRRSTPPALTTAPSFNCDNAASTVVQFASAKLFMPNSSPAQAVSARPERQQVSLASGECARRLRYKQRCQLQLQLKQRRPLLRFPMHRSEEHTSEL